MYLFPMERNESASRLLAMGTQSCAWGQDTKAEAHLPSCFPHLCFPIFFYHKNCQSAHLIGTSGSLWGLLTQTRDRCNGWRETPNLLVRPGHSCSFFKTAGGGKAPMNHYEACHVFQSCLGFCLFGLFSFCFCLFVFSEGGALKMTVTWVKQGLLLLVCCWCTNL